MARNSYLQNLFSHLISEYQRMPNDIALAKEAGGNDEIDIILGGHDHHYEDTVIDNVRVLNSGCDFKSFTTIQVAGRDEQTGTLETISKELKAGIPETLISNL